MALKYICGFWQNTLNISIFLCPAALYNFLWSFLHFASLFIVLQTFWFSIQYDHACCSYNYRHLVLEASPFPMSIKLQHYSSCCRDWAVKTSSELLQWWMAFLVLVGACEYFFLSLWTYTCVGSWSQNSISDFCLFPD